MYTILVLKAVLRSILKNKSFDTSSFIFDS